MTGAVTRGSTPAPAIFSGQSDGPKEMVVFIHLWCARRLRDPRLHRKDLPAKGLHVPPGDKLPAPAIHHVQLLAAVAVVGIGVVVVIDALQLSSGGLVPQLLLSGCGPAVRGLLLAGPLARRG